MRIGQTEISPLDVKTMEESPQGGQIGLDRKRDECSMVKEASSAGKYSVAVVVVVAAVELNLESMEGLAKEDVVVMERDTISTGTLAA